MRMSLVKSIPPEAVIEPWVYSTISHPSVLQAKTLEGKYSTSIQMPRGTTIRANTLTSCEFESLFATVIDFMLFCEENGTIHGDVKLENIIRYEETYRIIDFGIMHFPNLVYDNNTQTYIPDGPVLLARLRKEDSPHLGGNDTPFGRMLYAIGFLVFRWCNRIPFIRDLFEYTKIIRDPSKFTREVLGEWEPLVMECMYIQSVTSVKDLLPLIPIPIPRTAGEMRYSPTPDLPTRWNDAHDMYNETFYGITTCFSSALYMYPISMQLYWRYKGSMKSVVGDERLRALFCSCLAISGLLIGWIGTMSIATLAFHGKVSLETMRDVYDELRQVLEHRLPSLFRDGYGLYLSPTAEVFCHRISNPRNFQLVRDTVRKTNCCIITSELSQVVSEYAIH